MKYAILFIIAFALVFIAIDVSAIRSTVAPGKTLIESIAENIVEVTTKTTKESAK